MPWPPVNHQDVHNEIDHIRSSVFTPEIYGALGDGVTDDLAAIDAAIAALPPGGRLVFSPGKTYLVSGPVVIERIDGVTVEGAGATLVCTSTASPTRVLTVESCVGATVRGLTLQHANTDSRQSDDDGLAVRRCSDVTIANVKASSVRSVGIRVGGSVRVSVTDCHVQDTLADGIGVYGCVTDLTGVSVASGSTTLTLTAAHFSSADVGGFVSITGAGAAGGTYTGTITDFTAPDTVTITPATSTTVSSVTAKVVRHSEDVVIKGNHLSNTGDDAISSVGYLTLGGVAVVANRNVAVAGNTIRSSAARGIVFAGQTRGAITDNIIDTTQDGGIYCTAETANGGSFGCSDITIGGNVLSGCEASYPSSNYGSIQVGSGQDSYPVTGMSILGNTIRGGGSYYLGVGADSGTNTSASTTEILVADNVCLGGNGANAGINVIKTAGASVRGNRIDKPYTSAVSVSADCSGVVLIDGNVISNVDQGAGGYVAIDAAALAALGANLVDGVSTSAPTLISPPATVQYYDAANAWWGTNGALLHRFTVEQATVMRYINLYVGTASGNIQVGVVRLSPTDPTSWTELVMDSGVIACPASGAARVDCGSTRLSPGSYAAFFWADNTTVTVAHYIATAAYTANRLALSGTYAGGVTASGSGSFTNRYVGGLNLESA